MTNRTEQKFRVLFIDDDEQLQEKFRQAYCDFFITSTAQNIQQALEELERETYDAAVTGWYPDGFDGIKVTREIRSRYPDLHIFTYFKEPVEDALIRAFQAGASAYFIEFASLLEQQNLLASSIKNSLIFGKHHDNETPESQMLGNIIQLNPYAISVYDEDGHLVKFNNAYIDLFIIPMPQEYTIFNLGVFKGDPEYEEMFEKMRRGETVHSSMREYTNKKNHPSAPERIVHIAATEFCIKNKQGEIQNFVIMHEDMSEKVNAEEDLKKTHEELQKAHAALSKAHEDLKKSRDELEQRVQERTAELTSANKQLKEQIKERNKMSEILARKNRELEDFASRVSHDMKNSLLMLRRIIELSSNDPAEAQNTLKRLSQRSDQLMDFVEKLLNLAKAGKVIDRRKRQPLDPFIRLAFQRIKPSDIEGELNIPQKLPPVYGDIQSLENVFINLISNSFSYRDPEKEKVSIEITGRETSDSVELIYQDNGSGIDHAHQERIFDAGFTTLNKERSGFGLSIVKKIIKAHGGSVIIESSGKNQGTRFILTLPCSKS